MCNNTALNSKQQITSSADFILYRISFFCYLLPALCSGADFTTEAVICSNPRSIKQCLEAVLIKTDQGEDYFSQWPTLAVGCQLQSRFPPLNQQVQLAAWEHRVKSNHTGTESIPVSHICSSCHFCVWSSHTSKSKSFILVVWRCGNYKSLHLHHPSSQYLLFWCNHILLLEESKVMWKLSYYLVGLHPLLYCIILDSEHCCFRHISSKKQQADRTQVQTHRGKMDALTGELK